MTPSTSSCANDTRTLLADVDAHVPSVVPRTVIVTGGPPRLASTRKAHVLGSTTSSHPPEGIGGWPVSVVCVAHLVTMRVSVTPFSKSTSKRLNGAPKGVHCTEMTFMFGGKSTVSIG